MNIKTFVFNSFFENTSVISDKAGHAIIVDPGCYEDADQKQLTDYIFAERLNVMAIVNTHCHIDHVLGNEAMKAKYGVNLWVPTNEKEVLNAIPAYARSYGFADYREATVDHWFKEGQMTFGTMTFDVMEVPGHSPGHMVFYHAGEKLLIGGDVLFRESIGRTDLPGGNHEDLIRNIKEKVYRLPDEVTVYPGHGPVTTIGHEKQFNRFVEV